MSTTHQVKTPPAWQQARTALLQREFIRIKARVDQGQYVTHLLHRAAKRLDGRMIGEAAHKLWLSYPTLRRFYSRWQKNGELAAALKLNYRSGPILNLPAPVLVRFAEWCADHDCDSVGRAWRRFVTLPRNRSAAGKISYASLVRYFPVTTFKAIQAERKALALASDRLANLRLDAAADIRNALPDRPAKRESKSGNTWDI